MPDSYQLVYFVTAFLNTAIAVLIYVQRRSDVLVRAFVAFTLSIVGWISTLYFYYSSFDPATVIHIGRLNFVFASFIGFTAFLFVYFFPKKYQEISMKKWLFLTVVTLVIAGITYATDLVIRNEVIVGVSRETEFGQLYWMWLAHFLIFGIASIVMLIQKSKHLDKGSRKQIMIFAGGWAVALIGASATQLLLPRLLGNTDVQHLGPVFAIALLVTMAYLVVKHAFLNTRLIAAEFFITALLFLSLLNIVYATPGIGLTVAFIAFGIGGVIGLQLIKSIRKEVERREELQELSRKLEHANKELKDLDEARGQFINIASHQFRTPVSVMKGYLALMSDGAYGKLSDEVMEKVDHMYNMNERLVHLINNFLNASRIEKKKIDYILTSTDVENAIIGIVEDMQFRAREKGVNLTYAHSEKKLPLTWSDVEKLNEVLMNLLDNAIKYSPEGSDIIVDATHDHDKETVKICIADTGAGMTEEQREQLFQQYYRAENRMIPKTVGTGIGLFICKTFIEGMGGNIFVESTEEGKGTTFAFTLPIDAEDPQHEMKK